MLKYKSTKHNKTQIGATAVEMAIILPLFLILIFGIIEFSLLLYNKNIISHAAREGARVGSVYSYPQRISYDTIEEAVNRYIQDRLISFSSNTANIALSVDVPQTIIDDENNENIEYIYTGFDPSKKECPYNPGSRAKLRVLVTFEYHFLFLRIITVDVGSDAIMICE